LDKLELEKNLTESGNFKIKEALAKKDTIEPTPSEWLNIFLLGVKLERLRLFVGPIYVNSWFRSKKYNASLPHASSNSYHMTGLAGDIKFDFSIWNRKSLERVFKFIGFKNVNFYWTSDRKTFVWIHVDLGDTWNGKDFNYRDLDSITQLEIKL